jgi:flavin-dependent dehydrogenase
MASIRLASAGREVVLLEKERSAHHKVCGEFLSPEAVEYLRHAGIDPLRLGAASIHRLRLSARGRVIETALPFRALSLSRCVLDAALLAQAEAEGCAVRRGVAVQALAHHGDHWNAELSNGTSWSADAVFLATGKHDLRGWSRPAAKQNDLIGFKLHWRLESAQTEALRDSMELYLFKGGYGGLSLVESDAANLCLVVERSRLRELGGWPELIASLLSENRHIRRRLEGAQPAWERPLAVAAIPYGYLAARERGLWSIGDQAAVIPSFTGDGMSIALHSGALAADMCLNGETPDGYHRRLHDQLHRAMSLATLLSRAIVTRAAGELAPAALAVFSRAIGPRAIRWIADATRIPDAALVHAPPL